MRYEVFSTFYNSINDSPCQATLDSLPLRLYNRLVKTPTYEVTLPFFRGPLDLLLHLIQEGELEITKISLVQVTDQYLAYLSHLEGLEVETLADFIVVAAQLLLIKSRALLPQPPAGEFEEEEEIGDELVRRLIEYQKFKAAAQQLRSREEEGLRAYPRAIVAQPRPPFPLQGVSLNDLVEVLRQALQEQPVSSVGEVVTPLTISLPAKIRELERLTLRRRLNFNRLLRRAKSRLEIIVTFLALLQLIKRRKIAVQQDRPFGEITIFAI